MGPLYQFVVVLFFIASLMNLLAKSQLQTTSNSIWLTDKNFLLIDTNTTAHKLLQSAPYTIEDRVNLNATEPDSQANNNNLKRLLQTFNQNNQIPAGIEHHSSDYADIILFSNTGADSNSDSRNQLNGFNDTSALQEFIDDANSESRSLANSNNSVMKDNHKNKHISQIRSKPMSVVIAVDKLTTPSMTVPPIRRNPDITAENYTAKKIAEEANIFAMNLLHQSNVEILGSHNLIRSPFAVYQGLSLLLSGAVGDTARELDRVLLGSQSVYENTRLTHDQDRSRLIESLGEAISQLRSSASNHWTVCNNRTQLECPSSESDTYLGGVASQHLITANNLLFSSNAFEISSEFKNYLASYHNNTALTKIEVGSTESIHVLNSWARQVTAGLIPSIFKKRDTFDEFNVMTLLSTSWFAQEWQDNFHRITSSLRSGIRLKSQGPASIGRMIKEHLHGFRHGANPKTESLMEFVDDNKNSHFVDFIKCKPTRNIQHHHLVISGQLVDVTVIPFRDSNHRMVTLSPYTTASSSTAANGLSSTGSYDYSIGNFSNYNITEDGPQVQAPDSSPLSRLISTLTVSPRRALRSLWKTINPEIITKQSLSSIQMPKLTQGGNISVSDQRILVASFPPRVQLSIPTMRIDADESISPALNHIGIVNSFEPSQANFIGINGHPFNYNKLHLSNVITKTSFNVNENGINYDRTIRTLEDLRVHPERRVSNEANEKELEDLFKYELVDDVKLNRPFVYLICDFKTNLILYTGVLRFPAK